MIPTEQWNWAMSCYSSRMSSECKAMQIQTLQFEGNGYVSRIRQFGCKMRQIISIWPELPEYIKAAIKALIQTHITEKK